MSNQDNYLLDEIEPEVAERINAGRRDAFNRYGKLALVASAPVVLAMASKEAFIDTPRPPRQRR